MTDMADRDRKPGTEQDQWVVARRGKNIAIFSTIIALAVLFFVITILRMS
ncbi:hypothetical protein GCM10017083_37820 [Thalassobaculum fulvum]|uniref:Uncharacterized protein n=1 Tax=Thalassobaculum fulvum TaxID=1633335 RepID=A0A919CQW8_9PROT|nr:hypothetical protein GCM10017083_37820 [Thalassobaculum fulvum]